MKNKASRTAADVVALRALSSIAPPRSRIMVDELALTMLPRPWSWAEPLFSRPWLKPFTYHLGRTISNRLTGYRGTIELVALRYRHIDERLQAAYEKGIRQVVLLGAGYDYRSHRREYRDVRFIEVDHPKTQAGKHRLFRNHPTRTNGRIQYVAVDFHDDWAAQLEKAGVLQPEPTFVIWEGVAYYLNGTAVHYTLAALKRLLASGSILIFDSVPTAKQNGKIPSRELLLTAKYVAKKGEPLLWGGTVEEVAGMLGRHGFRQDAICHLSEVARRLGVEEGVRIPHEPIYDEFYLVEATV
jgi:methyltransferase (TIGR00027 family)